MLRKEATWEFEIWRKIFRFNNPSLSYLERHIDLSGIN